MSTNEDNKGEGEGGWRGKRVEKAEIIHEKKKKIDLNSQLNRLVSDVSQVLGFLGVFLENKFWDFENVFWFVSLTAMVFLAQFLGWNSYRKICHW